MNWSHVPGGISKERDRSVLPELGVPPWGGGAFAFCSLLSLVSESKLLIFCNLKNLVLLEISLMEPLPRFCKSNGINTYLCNFGAN
jgi:hypothetical protein